MRLEGRVTRALILTRMQQHGGGSATEMAAAIGREVTAVRDHLNRLMRDGLVTVTRRPRIGPGRKTLEFCLVGAVPAGAVQAVVAANVAAVALQARSPLELAWSSGDAVGQYGDDPCHTV